MMHPERPVLPTCAVVVLNWNGRTHLEALLPSLYAARERAGQALPIVVVDNRSTANDVAWLRAEHPTVDVSVAAANDCLFSLNPVVSDLPEDVIIVLNNDMRVDPDFIAPLLAHFADPQVFAVAANTLDWEGGRRQHGQRLIRIHRFWCYHWFDRSVTRACYTAEAGGGCSAYRRTYFAELGGFDTLYRPAYWEDFDLSYRAWARGWSSIFEPSSVIYHRGSATLTETLPGGRIGRLLARNQLLFILSNIGGWGFAVGVLALLPYRLAMHAWRGNWSLVRGQIAALGHIPAALQRRSRRPSVVRAPQAIVAELASPVGGGAKPPDASSPARVGAYSVVIPA